MRNPKLVRVAPITSRETIDACAALLEAAKKGEIIGIAYVALHLGLDYSGDIVGTARTTPIIARGLVGTLWDKISRFQQLK